MPVHVVVDAVPMSLISHPDLASDIQLEYIPSIAGSFLLCSRMKMPALSDTPLLWGCSVLCHAAPSRHEGFPV